MQPAFSGPTGLRFNENAAQPHQHVEMTGCLWFGTESFIFFYCAFLLQQLKLCLAELPRQSLSPKTQQFFFNGQQFVSAECEMRL